MIHWAWIITAFLGGVCIPLLTLNWMLTGTVKAMVRANELLAMAGYEDPAKE